MRKEAGFEVTDRITVYAKDNDRILEILAANEETVKSEVLADEIVTGHTEGYEKEWNINGQTVSMGVKRA